MQPDQGKFFAGPDLVMLRFYIDYSKAYNAQTKSGGSMCDACLEKNSCVL